MIALTAISCSNGQKKASQENMQEVEQAVQHGVKQATEQVQQSSEQV